MRNIIKIDLDFEKTYDYFIDHLECGEELSIVIIKKINLKEGSFFTLLPENSIMDQLYQFSWGGIIPPIPGDETYYVDGKEFCPQRVVTIDEELAQYFLTFLNKHPENYVLLEDVVANINDPYIKNIRNEGIEVISNKEEVYYLLKSNNSIKQILKTIGISGQVWHFLAVVGTGANSIIRDSKQIDFEAVCETLNYIITGAYDGEGYIFWENGKRIPMWTPYEFLKARNDEEIFNF